MWITALLLFGPALLLLGMGIAFQNTKAIGFAEYGQIAEIIDTANGVTFRLLDLQFNFSPPAGFQHFLNWAKISTPFVIQYIFGLLFNIPKYIKLLLSSL